MKEQLTEYHSLLYSHLRDYAPEGAKKIQSLMFSEIVSIVSENAGSPTY